MGEALREGINRYTLHKLVETGLAERLSRGLYRLTEMPEVGNPDLVTVPGRVPGCVICLISALSFHDITTQIPHQVMIALSHNLVSHPPRIEHPPIRVFWFGEEAFGAGVEVHEIDGFPVRIYSPEKTIADCFKYRHKIGLGVAVEALRLYREGHDFRANVLLEFARVCRVHNVMMPYLEALL
jgi:predicted transcriptional regulator of viral defense system